MKTKDTKIIFNKTIRIITSDWDAKAMDSIASGEGFRITEEGKTDTNEEPGYYSIHSPLYGMGYSDEHAFEDRYSCKCGRFTGKNYENYVCPKCNTKVQFSDVDMTKTGWIILDKDVIINPIYFNKIKAFIGQKVFPEIIKYKELHERSDTVPYDGIGMIEFYERFDEIMDYYLMLYPHKKNYYDDIMAHKSIVFTHSIPVFTTLLRPTKLDSIGSLKYEKTNENYNLLAHLVYAANKNKLVTDRQKKGKYQILFDIQEQFNLLYTELVKILKGKKGDLRSSIGGRYGFSERSVIKQDVYLMPDQVKLPYHGLCELLQQVIINILVRTYNFSYADAYKKWYKAQIGFDQIVYDIIDGLIKDSDGGIPVLINVSPYIIVIWCTNAFELLGNAKAL